MIQRLRSRSGQSIVEVLIGIAVGALFIMGAATIIAPSLWTQTNVTQVQTATQLGSELVDNVRAWAQGNWNGVLSLATGSAYSYYLNTSSSPFTASSTIQSITIGGVVYKRYFYVSDVYRDTNGNVTSTTGNCSGNAPCYDPSTKQVTVGINAASSTSATTTYIMYITRNANNVFNQTSWAGGSDINGPVTVASTTYSAATSVTISAGAIKLSPPVGDACTM